MQEGLTNAVRHGRADRIEIRITRTGNAVSVSVRDNGTGCAELEEGFGLQSGMLIAESEINIFLNKS